MSRLIPIVTVALLIVAPSWRRVVNVSPSEPVQVMFLWEEDGAGKLNIYQGSSLTNHHPKGVSGNGFIVVSNGERQLVQSDFGPADTYVLQPQPPFGFRFR